MAERENFENWLLHESKLDKDDFSACVGFLTRLTIAHYQRVEKAGEDMRKLLAPQA